MTPEERDLRLQARRTVATALRRGELVRGPCEICGDPRTDAHHPSYKHADWLAVHWLCRIHHRAAHRLLAQIAARRTGRWRELRATAGWRERIIELMDEARREGRSDLGDIGQRIP